MGSFEYEGGSTYSLMKYDDELTKKWKEEVW